MTDERAYSFVVAARMLGISRSMIYELVQQSRIPIQQVGPRRIIRHADLKAFLATLPVMVPLAKRGAP